MLVPGPRMCMLDRCSSTPIHGWGLRRPRVCSRPVPRSRMLMPDRRSSGPVQAKVSASRPATPPSTHAHARPVLEHAHPWVVHDQVERGRKLGSDKPLGRETVILGLMAEPRSSEVTSSRDRANLGKREWSSRAFHEGPCLVRTANSTLTGPRPPLSLPKAGDFRRNVQIECRIALQGC